MISHEHKFIFVRIPKTASTSIINALYRECGKMEGHENHEDINYYIRKYSNVHDYFKFTFVRNPWELRYSYYFYNKNLPGRHGKYARNLSLKDWILRYSGKNSQVRRTQLEFVGGNINNMDFIGKFETLQEDFNIICDKIGIPRQELPHKNKSTRKHYTEYYDDETRQIVAEKFAKDIEYFGYEFGK